MARMMIMLAAVAFLAILVNGRHIHVADNMDSRSEDISDIRPQTDIEGLSIDAIRNFKANGFVPMNNILFFKAFPLCKDGFKRDVLGICREVWD